MVSETERYFFDVNGYLVVKDALSKRERDGINAAIDRGVYNRPEHKTAQGHYETYLDNNTALRGLIDNPRVLPYLHAFMGAERAESYAMPGQPPSPIRLDHSYFIFSEPGTPRGTLHLGNTPYVPSCSYHVRDREIFSGLTVVSYVLNEVPPGQGGFACIPGSHKANFPCPKDYAQLSDLSSVVSPKVSPGDAILFTEALTHGSMPWNASHMRRALFFKYTPHHIAWAHPRWSPAVRDQCTPGQRALLEPPYVVDAPDFFQTSDRAMPA